MTPLAAFLLGLIAGVLGLTIIALLYKDKF